MISSTNNDDIFSGLTFNSDSYNNNNNNNQFFFTEDGMCYYTSSTDSGSSEDFSMDDTVTTDALSRTAPDQANPPMNSYSSSSSQFVQSTFSSTPRGTVLSATLPATPPATSNSSTCGGDQDGEEDTLLAFGTTPHSDDGSSGNTSFSSDSSADTISDSGLSTGPSSMIWGVVEATKCVLMGLLVAKDFGTSRLGASEKRETINRSFKGLPDSKGVKSATAKTFLFCHEGHLYNMYEVRFTNQRTKKDLDTSLLQVDASTGLLSAAAFEEVKGVIDSYTSKPFARKMLCEIRGDNKVTVGSEWVDIWRSHRDDDVVKYKSDSNGKRKKSSSNVDADADDDSSDVAAQQQQQQQQQPRAKAKRVRVTAPSTVPATPAKTKAKAKATSGSPQVFAPVAASAMAPCDASAAYTAASAMTMPTTTPYYPDPAMALDRDEHIDDSAMDAWMQ